MSVGEHAQAVMALSIKRVCADVDAQFALMLPDPPDPICKLFEAMRYAAIGGGKRLRPLLTMAVADLFDVAREQALRAGLAAECIHVQSLIHDDLPCMDDDVVRRGKPTVHIAFNEATAVLAGDALLALAFEILGEAATHPDGAVRAELVCALARAAGGDGMAGGQMLDLLSSDAMRDIEVITRLQRLKTGALIAWCAEAGAILGRASGEIRLALRGYAQNVGLAFQIADDLLDRTGDERTVGKTLGKDARQGKASFVTFLGEERARRQAEMLVEQAIEHVRAFGERAQLLIAIARFAIERDY